MKVGDEPTTEGFGFSKLLKLPGSLAKFSISAVGKAARIKSMPNISDVIRAVRSQSEIQCSLAASYGNLNKESFKTMDKEMKVIIGYTIGSLAQLGGNTGWDSVLRCMNGNSLIGPDRAANRASGITKSGGGAFKTDGSPSRAIVREVHSWFVGLISDSDVMNDTGIDIDLLGRMVAESGASIDNFGAFFYKKVNKSKDVMDVSILRYPDLDHPYFKVYRIRLCAWRNCERFLFIQKDHSGIKGEFNAIKYSPKPEVVARLNSKVVDAAVKEAEDLFS